VDASVVDVVNNRYDRRKSPVGDLKRHGVVPCAPPCHPDRRERVALPPKVTTVRLRNRTAVGNIVAPFGSNTDDPNLALSVSNVFGFRITQERRIGLSDPSQRAIDRLHNGTRGSWEPALSLVGGTLDEVIFEVLLSRRRNEAVLQSTTLTLIKISDRHIREPILFRFQYYRALGTC
jgi:hypothetical protein